MQGDLAIEVEVAEQIMADEELRIDYLETQLELMNTLGEPLYLARCVSRPSS